MSETDILTHLISFETSDVAENIKHKDDDEGRTEKTKVILNRKVKSYSNLNIYLHWR